MWVFMSNAFLSIVAHRTKPGVLLVRARRAGDIRAAFPRRGVEVTPAADYRYRAEIPGCEVAAAIARQVCAIDYDNFKGSVHDGPRHDAYMRVWSAMAAYQHAEASAAPVRARKRPAKRRR